jgi:hypothetical protein
MDIFNNIYLFFKEREREKYIIYKEREKYGKNQKGEYSTKRGNIAHKKVFPRERRLLRVKSEKACYIPPNRAIFPPAKK